MVKPIISSKDLNEKMYQSDQDMEKIKQTVQSIQEDLVKKMKIIRNEELYANSKIHQLEEYIAGGQYNPTNSGSKVVFGAGRSIQGEYELFGNTIHPKFVRAPRNVFNIITASGPLFRSNMLTYLNDEINDDVKKALMLDGAKGKEPFYNEYKTNQIKITIEVDRSSLLGDTHFNLIELVPYLEGSFDIKKIKLWEIHSPGVTIEDYATMEEACKSRILLNRKYELFSIEFTIQLNYRNDAGLYPFGIHSLQFLNADMQDSSYVIMEIAKKDYIESIGNDILLKGSFQETNSTLSDEDIRVYIEYSEGVLSSEIEVSVDDVIHPIARNAKTLYLHMPLKKALKSMTVLQLETR